MTVYAGHYFQPAQDSSGRAIPNATFQLYKPGTKIAPTYYTDRTKGVVVSGDPKSDENGNVDIWPDPGIYEYWYGGKYIQLVTVDQDDDEDDAAIAAAVATINATLTGYYTAAQVDSAIASGGGPTVGAELLSHKNQNNGYAGLDSTGVVAAGQLPTSATSGARTPTTHGSTHDVGGSDPIDNLSGYLGLAAQTITASQNAVEGKMYVCNMIGNITVTLLAPSSANAKPVAVKRLGASNTLTVTGLIDTVSSAVVSIPIDSAVIWFVPDINNSGWFTFSNYVPFPSIARLDADNDFGDHINYNYRDSQANFSSATLLAGTDVGWGRNVQTTNAAGCVVTLPNNAKVGDWMIVGQGATVQTSFTGATGVAFVVEADSYTKTAKQNARVLVQCISNGTGTTAGYLLSGYTSA